MHTRERQSSPETTSSGVTSSSRARIAEIAEPDEILVSSVIREIASSRGDLRFGTERAVKLKGLGETQRVYPLLWEDM